MIKETNECICEVSKIWNELTKREITKQLIGVIISIMQSENYQGFLNHRADKFIEYWNNNPIDNDLIDKLITKTQKYLAFAAFCKTYGYDNKNWYF